MYCTNCGKEIDDNSNFCIHCGKKATLANNSIGKITFKRPGSFIGCLVSIKVYIDKVYVGSLKDSSSFTCDISYGKHEIITELWSGICKREIEVRTEAPNLEATVSLQMGLITNKPKIISVIEK